MTDARTNYIKRLVGLPGETVRIQHGDMWIRRQDKSGDAAFRIARKPPRKLLAMLQPVFDNDYMPRIAKYGWPARWHADAGAAAHRGRAPGLRTTMRVSTPTARPPASNGCDTTTWCRRSSSGKAEVGAGPPTELAPQLITDFTAYDTGRIGGRTSPDRPRPRRPGAVLGRRSGLATARPTWKATRANRSSSCARAGGDSSAAFDAGHGQATLSISGPGMENVPPDGADQRSRPGPPRNPLLELRRRIAAVGRRQTGQVRRADDLR